MGKVLGIDLGTTNSAMAIIVDGKARIIENAEGHATTPSVVNFSTETDWSVGVPALAKVLSDPRHTVTSIKRFMGSSYDESAEARAKANYPVVRGPRGGVRVQVKMRERSVEEIMEMLDKQRAERGLDLLGGSVVLSGANGEEYSPEQLSGFILSKLKADAEAYLARHPELAAPGPDGAKVTQAVITVPAYFNDAQRQATRAAGRLAGLEVLRIVSEPTAAALAYGIGSPDKDETCMIFDLGGGTFDVSILQIREGVFRVLSTYGDNRLGGDDWDRRLMDHLADEFLKEHGIDLRKDQSALEQLHNAAIQAKIALSSSEQTRVFVEGIAARDGDSLNLDVTLTRRQFERMTAGLLGRLKIPMDMAVQGAGISVKDLDEVVLVGGSTRMPAVRKMVERYTHLEPNASVNPDEAVALGAAVQGGLLNGEVKGASLLDVTPLSLGVETRGGVMQVLIARNTTIPAHAEEVFLTTQDGQTAVTIGVYQGERGIARDNKALGSFRLEGIPALPRGKAQIEVSFDIDANGVVAVCAREVTTGVEQRIHITGSTQLSDEDIQAMLADSEAHSAEDAAYQRLVELQSEADSLVYWTRKALKEHPNWVSAVQREVLAARAAALAEVRERASEEDTAALAAAIDALREAREPLEAAAQTAREARGML